ncbi:MAG: NADPH:quinone oxidoreductase family protein, partial [Candidatus Marinimicrobia bacterium]|nr:NADPH:quinone oxidoreductase family protein [Candidatus Neomarinimicrobiota bacterium]
MMKALLCKEFTAVENLTWEDVPDPYPQDGEVIIEIKAAALNFPDYLIVQGLYQFKPPLPFSPGSEGAGTISAVGKNVTEYKVGDRVSFMSGWGAFCEKIAVNQKQVIKIPDTITFDLAAATQIAYGTSYHALIQRGNLTEKDEILILGASGGVGLAALDIAKAFNARVVAGISSEEKAVVCRNYGADDVVIYGTEKLDTEGQK